jgi:uracil phosphoribosyltransferase
LENMVHVINHPLVRHKLTRCRQIETAPREFRELMEQLTVLLLYEAMRDLPLAESDIITPVAAARGHFLTGPEPVFVVVLRAGLGMLEGALRLFPEARSGHIGLYRDPETLEPVQYYCKLPDGIEGHPCYLLEPMLATGGSAVHALNLLKEAGASGIKLLSLIASPEGIEAIGRHHPDVAVFLAAVDVELNKKGYIVPGLGDAGDRLYGTCQPG